VDLEVNDTIEDIAVIHHFFSAAMATASFLASDGDNRTIARLRDRLRTVEQDLARRRNWEEEYRSLANDYKSWRDEESRRQEELSLQSARLLAQLKVSQQEIEQARKHTQDTIAENIKLLHSESKSKAQISEMKDQIHQLEVQLDVSVRTAREEGAKAAMAEAESRKVAEDTRKIRRSNAELQAQIMDLQDQTHRLKAQLEASIHSSHEEGIKAVAAEAKSNEAEGEARKMRAEMLVLTHRFKALNTVGQLSEQTAPREMSSEHLKLLEDRLEEVSDLAESLVVYVAVADALVKFRKEHPTARDPRWHEALDYYNEKRVMDANLYNLLGNPSWGHLPDYSADRDRALQADIAEQAEEERQPSE